MSDITTIVDKSTSTNISNYNTITRLTDNTPDTIVSKESIAYVITEYKQGPIGPPGTPEDQIMYAKRVDFIDSTLLYRAEASPGTLNSASVWRIRKITIAATDSDVTETWADGNDNFDNVWDNRLTYTYS